MTSVQDIRLLAEKGVALVVQVLYDLRFGPAILDSERVLHDGDASSCVCRAQIMAMAQTVIMLKVRDAVLPISPVSRLVILLDAQIARDDSQGHVVQAAFLSEQPVVGRCVVDLARVIYRSQVVHLVGLRGAH